jgi:hypothetical protein
VLKGSCVGCDQCADAFRKTCDDRIGCDADDLGSLSLVDLENFQSCQGLKRFAGNGAPHTKDRG